VSEDLEKRHGLQYHAPVSVTPLVNPAANANVAKGLEQDDGLLSSPQEIEEHLETTERQLRRVAEAVSKEARASARAAIDAAAMR